MAVLLVQIAQRQDVHAAQQARQFASSALDRRREAIAKEIKDYAAWGEGEIPLLLNSMRIAQSGVSTSS